MSSVILFSTNVYAQEQKINENSLVACVDYHLNKIEERGDNVTSKEFNIKAVITIMCELGYEHTGKYTNLLPEDMQSKYLEMATLQIFLKKVPLN